MTHVDPSGHTNRDRPIAWVLFFMLLLSYSYFLPRWQDPNQNSRLDMVVAVVDDGTLQIDRYVKNTVDYAKVGEHYYSDKAPGTAIVGIPVYAILRMGLRLPVVAGLMTRLSDNKALMATLRKDGSGLVEEKVRFAIAQVALTFAAAALPSALLGVLMFLLLRRFTTSVWQRLLVVLGYGLLTPVFAYANAFYGHQLSAACLFAAFYLLFMPDKQLRTGNLIGAGFLMGFSVITEYPTALVVGILMVYAVYRLVLLWDRSRWAGVLRAGWIALPGALLAALLLGYNRLVFGSFFDLGYSHSELWTAEHSQGLMSITWPHLAALWGITFSPFRGLFVLSPLLLLAVPGFVLWWQSDQHQAAFWACLATVVAIFLFNSSSVMWWGGFAVGPRYILPMLPFLALTLIYPLMRWGNCSWFRILTALLYLLSLLATWGLTLAEQAFPPDTIYNPLVQFALPNWMSGNIARNLGMFLHLTGISSLLPLLVVLTALLVLLGWLSRQPVSSEAIR